jgi:hypothetical protein
LPRFEVLKFGITMVAASAGVVETPPTRARIKRNAGLEKRIYSWASNV